MNEPHTIVSAPDLAPAVGYAHAVVADRGRLVCLGGQTAQDPDGAIRAATIVDQFDVAASNVVKALRAAEAEPEHLVSMVVFVTDMEAYRGALKELGPIWRRHFGRRYPAMAAIGVNALLDEAAKVELLGVAVVP